MALFHRSLILVVFLVIPLVGHARAETRTASTVSLVHSRTHLLVVSARINGQGPFKFILDTGSNITLLESSLFRELGLKGTSRPSVKVVDWMALGNLAIADEISIEGGPSRSYVRVLEVDGVKRPDIGASIRGVLGENFLNGFDLLIDNRRHVITFDSYNLVAPSLKGEHLPLTLTSANGGVQINDRPIVSARLPPPNGGRPLELLLDTGGENLYLVTRQGPDLVTANSRRRMSLLSGNSRCVSWKDRLQLGGTKTRKMKIISCSKSPAAVWRNDGILPTFVFDQLFIDHAHDYVIINPIISEKLDEESLH